MPASATTDASQTAAIQTDAELIDATLDAVTDALPHAPLDPSQAFAAWRRAVGVAARQPGALLRRTQNLLTEQARIASGTSSIDPYEEDKRFADPAWSTNLYFRTLGQHYLAWSRELHGLVDDLELDDKSRMRTEYLATLVSDAAAPTNRLFSNPTALEEARKTNGKSLAAGARHALHDLLENDGMPSMVDDRPFTPGDTIAATPGSVVFSNDVLELIQYTPATAEVYERPLLVVPPQINKYYILDLAPGRSLIEHAVTTGHQVFAISWRNPDPTHRDWDLDTYVSAVLDAAGAALEVTGQPDLNLLGVCAGGITSAAMLGHLANTGDDRVHSATFLVTILDWSAPSLLGSFLSGPTVAASVQRSRAKGILSGEELAKVFAWMRPKDLVWNYWVNNYLLGKNPPAFDVLAWNGDSTNLPAGLHADFSAIASENQLTTAGAVEVLGRPIDLAKVEVPTYVIGAETDHITPWEACYETVNLLGGESEFVRSSQGHIQAMVNPTGNPKGHYHTNSDTPTSPEEWLQGATEHKGSWWSHWTGWLEPKAGKLVSAPAELGSPTHPAGVPAPGTYVLA